MKTQQIFDYPIFNLGFRAFFALAGLSALALIALWTSIFDGSLEMDNYYPSLYWHGHEMLLGYATAVISGFLLTAVKNWTGKQTIQGDSLAMLCLLWLYGRIVPFYSELLPDFIIAAIDFAFLPALIICVFKPIAEVDKPKMLLFPTLLSVMVLGNALIHAEVLGFAENTATFGINLVVTTIIMMIMVIAGRVFPFFTERALSGVLIIRNPLFDGLAIASALCVFILLLMNVTGTTLAVAAIVAVITNIMRIGGWYVHRIWFLPLLWVLYIGYGWIILGFILTALSAYNVISPTLAIHAFTVGGIGVLTLGMMARVSLGHTGRALRVSNAIALAFVLINVASLFRVLMPFLLPDWYANMVYFSTLCWLAAFSLFILVYTPILTAVREDGKEG
ncbi:MAG: NnrS family protein [Methylococcaceae bacterium]|nr:NnrS family protein [Methylococcaceae bacterium]